MDENLKSKAKLGDNKALEVTRKGTLQIDTKEQYKNTQDKYYASGLKHIRWVLDNLWTEIVFDNKETVIQDDTKGDCVIAIVPMSSNRIFLLKLKA